MSTPGMSVHEVAQKLLEPVETEETQEAIPAEPSEVDEIPIETSEEVVEEEVTEPVETEEVIEASEGETREFITELNDYLKDPSEFDKIRIPTKVNGVEGEATLSEILTTHRIGQASEERLNTLKTEKAEFEQQKAQQQTQYNEQLTQAANLVTALEKRLTTDAENIDWQTLRETDPAEYSAKRQDILERQQELQNTRTAISQEHQTKVNEAFNTLVQQESSVLTERIPEWSDDSLAMKEKGEIRDYLLSNGFSQLEIDGKQDANGNVQQIGLVKANAIELARKAMLFDRGEKAVTLTKKKVKKLPKVTKPGKPATSQEVDTEKSKAMRGRLKKSGKMEDAAAIIKQRMFGG